MTRTYVVLQISESAYKEIELKLQQAGYDHAVTRDSFYGPLIYMGGIALADVSYTEEAP